MTDCTSTRLEFARCQRRRVEAEFSGGEISSEYSTAFQAVEYSLFYERKM